MARLHLNRIYMLRWRAPNWINNLKIDQTCNWCKNTRKVRSNVFVAHFCVWGRRCAYTVQTRETIRSCTMYVQCYGTISIFGPRRWGWTWTHTHTRCAQTNCKTMRWECANRIRKIYSVCAVTFGMVADSGKCTELFAFDLQIDSMHSGTAHLSQTVFFKVCFVYTKL